LEAQILHRKGWGGGGGGGVGVGGGGGGGGGGCVGVGWGGGGGRGVGGGGGDWLSSCEPVLAKEKGKEQTQIRSNQGAKGRSSAHFFVFGSISFSARKEKEGVVGPLEPQTSGDPMKIMNYTLYKGVVEMVEENRRTT